MLALLSHTDREKLQHGILEATPERMLREMVEALEALIAETLLVLRLEYLQWSDYSTFDLISFLARPCAFLPFNCVQSGFLLPAAYGDLAQQAAGKDRCYALIGCLAQDQRRPILFSQPLQP